MNQDQQEKEVLELEYLPFPNLAEIFLFRKIGANRWENIVKSLFDIYSEFYLNKKTKNYLYNASYLYSEKLKNRINILNKIVDNLNNELLKKIRSNGIKVNNNILPSLNTTINKIQKRTKRN